MAGRAVVCRHARAVEQRRAPGARRVAKAQQGGGLARQPVLQDRERRDPRAATDQQRPPPRRRGPEPAAERPERPHLLALLQLAQPPRARADVLQQEVRFAPPPARDREGPRQVGPLVDSPAPGMGGRQHGELTGIGLWRPAVGDAQHAVGAELVHARHPEQAAREGRLAHAVRAPCSSCRHSTAARRSRSRAPPTRRRPAWSGRECRASPRRGESHTRPCVRRHRWACSRPCRRRRARSNPARVVSLRRSCSSARPARPCARSPRPCRAWQRCETRCRAGSAPPRSLPACRSR